MADTDIGSMLAGLKASDLMVGSDGRVIIGNTEVADKLKGTGALGADLAARSDTNIICCGNSKCGGQLDSILEQVVSRAGARIG